MHSPDEMIRAGNTTHRGLRHWEAKGLLGEVARTTGGTRTYTPEQLNRAKLIKLYQLAGFSLEEIRSGKYTRIHICKALNEQIARMESALGELRVLGYDL